MLARVYAPLYKHNYTFLGWLKPADLCRRLAADVRPAHEARLLDGAAILRIAPVRDVPLAPAAMAPCSPHPLHSHAMLRCAGG